MRTIHRAGPTPAGQTSEPHPSGVARWVGVLWPFALTAAIFATVGHLGFQPTDEGNVLAQSHRILDGQVPHRDVIFARPMGSAFFHVLDFLIPMPLFEASRLVGIAEIVVYSMCLAWLVYDVAPARWGVVRWTAAAAAVLVNTHTFLLNGWYTTDGLLLVAAGLVLLRAGLATGRRWVAGIGMLSLGAAVLMKQSFVLAPVIGLVWVWAANRSRPRGERRRIAATSAALLALPILAYMAGLAAYGALSSFFDQIVGADTVYGANFVTAFGSSRTRGEVLSYLGILLALLGSSFAARTIARRRTEGRALALIEDVAARAGITLVVLRLVLVNRFAYGGTWGLVLTWAVVLMVLWRLVAERRFDGAGAVLALTAWMASLSWGYPVPNLVAGSMALYLIDRTWRGVELPARPAGRTAPSPFAAAAAILTLTACALVGAGFLDARHERPYDHRPDAELTASLRAASPEFGRIRTNEHTADYLIALTDCVRSHPARWTAVIPDNPGIYPSLDLRNPFPIDWMYPDEVAGEDDRILEAARRIARVGDYTVMFQTFAIERLIDPGPPPPDASPASAPLPRSLLTRIWAALDGTRFTCGPFVGVTTPPRPA